MIVPDSHLSLVGSTQMPAIGLGTWKIDKSRCGSLMEEAITLGYRHFDCACDYGNEAEVGAGLANVFESGAVSREECWITSKLWNTYHSKENVGPALERSLRDLQVEYVDLYLIHFPIALRYVDFETRYPPGWTYDPDADTPRMELVTIPMQETWQAMEKLVKRGLTRHIGVCNCTTAILRDLLSYAEIPPAVLQVELHPYLVQSKLIRYCHEQNIAVTGFSPLGASSYFALNMAEERDSVLREPVVQQIASGHQRTPAQVVLRWGIQRGTAVIPKTSRADRLAENIALFDFELSEGEMNTISDLDQNRRFNDPGVFCEQAFNTFCPIYE